VNDPEGNDGDADQKRNHQGQAFEEI